MATKYTISGVVVGPHCEEYQQQSHSARVGVGVGSRGSTVQRVLSARHPLERLPELVLGVGAAVHNHEVVVVGDRGNRQNPPAGALGDPGWTLPGGGSARGRNIGETKIGLVVTLLSTAWDPRIYAQTGLESQQAAEVSVPGYAGEVAASYVCSWSGGRPGPPRPQSGCPCPLFCSHFC